MKEVGMQGSRPMYLVLALIVLWLLPGGLFANVAVLAFEVEAFDLQTGLVVEIDPMATLEESDGDFSFGYHADRSTHTVLVPNVVAGVEIAFLDATYFDEVTYGEVADLPFTADFPDEPFEASDTVVLKTGLGEYFKIGNADESLDFVSFDYAALLDSTLL